MTKSAQFYENLQLDHESSNINGVFMNKVKYDVLINKVNIVKTETKKKKETITSF